MNTDDGWAVPPNPSMSASGGSTGTYSVGPISYKYHVITSDGNFVITQLDSGAGSQPNEVDVLLVAGGGGSEPGTPVGGGGGGGGLLEGTLTFTSSGTYPVVISWWSNGICHWNWISLYVLRMYCRWWWGWTE